MKKIILASQSPRRKDLLSQIGLKLEIDKSNYQEDMSLNMKPEKLAEYLSLQKAKEVAKRHKNSIIIAADTFISFKGKLLGKPKTKKDALNMLRELSGKTHFVISGFTIIDTQKGKQISKSAKTKIYFRDISEKEISSYVATEEPLDKAGSYAIQGFGAIFVDKIEGDYFNVVGLPLGLLVKELSNFGVNVF